MNIRRVFLSTINYDHPQKGMTHAFQGVFGRENVAEYDYYDRVKQTGNIGLVNDEFLEQVLQFKPDWLWLQLQNTEIIRASTIKKVREALPHCVVSHWMGDARPSVGEYLASVCASTHVTFLSSIKHIPMYLAAGAPEVRYLQIGLDWEEDILQIPDWTPPFQIPDVVFIGNYYGDMFPGTPDRVMAVNALMAAGINIGVVGSGWDRNHFPLLGSCHVKQQVHIWKRAKVGISVNHFNDAAGYYSDRHLIALASGTPLVCQRIPDLDKDFEDGEELFMFSSKEELVDHVKMLLDHPAMRTAMGAAGRRRVFMEHTWFVRIFDVLQRVNEIHGGIA